MMKKYKKDIFIFSILLVIIIFLWLYIDKLHINKAIGTKVVIIYNNNVIKEMPLNTDTEYIYQTEQDYNRIIIKDSKAYVEAANCPDKICKHHKSISNVDEEIICIPHKLIIRIEK